MSYDNEKSIQQKHTSNGFIYFFLLQPNIKLTKKQVISIWSNWCANSSGIVYIDDTQMSLHGPTRTFAMA